MIAKINEDNEITISSENEEEAVVLASLEHGSRFFLNVSGFGLQGSNVKEALIVLKPYT